MWRDPHDGLDWTLWNSWLLFAAALPASTMLWETFFRQTHTARHRQINRKNYPAWFQGTCLLLLKSWTWLHSQEVLGRDRSSVIGSVLMLGLSCLGDISLFFFSFNGITGCGSASLKLCVCNAASPWSQSTSPDSQCGDGRGNIVGIHLSTIWAFLSRSVDNSIRSLPNGTFIGMTGETWNYPIPSCYCCIRRLGWWTVYLEPLQHVDYTKNGFSWIWRQKYRI